MADDQAPAEAFDATDAAANANAGRDVARKRREDADVLRKLMFEKAGRAFLYRRLESCKIFEAGLEPGMPDVTAFNLGKQEIGKRLMEDAMGASVDLYVKMVKEQREEEARLETVRSQESAKRREREESPTAAAMLAVQNLAPPPGYPGHVPPKRPASA